MNEKFRGSRITNVSNSWRFILRILVTAQMHQFALVDLPPGLLMLEPSPLPKVTEEFYQLNEFRKSST